jgi:thymidylate synthase
MKPISIITSVNNDNLIGIKEYNTYSIPCPFIKDLSDNFKRLTTTVHDDKKNAIIMDKNIASTLSELYFKQPNRINLIIDEDSKIKTFVDAMDYCNDSNNIENIFVIGGSNVYNEALQWPSLNKIYLTHIHTTWPNNNECELLYYFPILLQNIKSDLKCVYDSGLKTDTSKNINYQLYEFEIVYPVNYVPTKLIELYNGKVNESLDEYQYINLIKHIMTNGLVKNTRNGITRSIFGYQLKYDLQKGYPLSTIKKSYPKAIFEELMWIIRGQTNSKILENKGVNIWQKNSTKEFLEKHKLSYAEGDIGPGYGFQMRHFGADYIDCNTDYSDKGTDQLAICIDLIKKSPESRRIIIDLWNCMDINKQALPPCHMIYNFGVDTENGLLNCHLVQRSWDVLLGWNTTTAALLTYLLAHHCGLQPGILVHSITDAHLYDEHIKTGLVEKILERKPRSAPKLKFVTNHNNIESYEYNDTILEDYYPCPSVSFDMVT